MIKKRIGFLLCIVLVFISKFAIADRIEEPYSIMINDIPVTRWVATKIFDNAKYNHIDIYNAQNRANKVDVVTKGTNVIIDSLLMDMIVKAYAEVMAKEYTVDDVIVHRDDNGVIVFVKIKIIKQNEKYKVEGLVEDLILDW
jgi:hypothetical protein